MRVLEAFDAARDSLSLTDIVQLTGMGKSAAQRFTHTWEALGYLAKDPQSRRYRLGPKVVELSYYFLRSDHLVSLAAPHLVALREHCGLAVNMSVLSGDDMIYLLRLPSRQLTLVEMLPGRRMPAWSNSAGRMLLSQRDDASVRDLLARAAPQLYTPRTQTDPRRCWPRSARPARTATPSRRTRCCSTRWAWPPCCATNGASRWRPSASRRRPTNIRARAW